MPNPLPPPDRWRRHRDPLSGPRAGEERLGDLDAYRALIWQVEQLDTLARRCWSPATARLIRITRLLVRATASGLWQRVKNGQGR